MHVFKQSAISTQNIARDRLIARDLVIGNQKSNMSTPIG